MTAFRDPTARPLEATPPEPVARVLLVDEDRDAFLRARAVVESIDGGRYRLTWASTPADGLAALATGDFESCLLDHAIGGRTGLDFLRAAREQGILVPIIVLTGHGTGALEREFLAAGAADYLPKSRLDSDVAWRSLRHAVERTRALAAQRARELQLRAMFHAALDAMLVADDDGRYVDANPAALELVGVSLEELRTLRVWDLAPAHLREPSAGAWARFLLDGRMSGEYTLQRPDGGVRVVEFRATAHFQPNRHLSVLRDVTARRQAESSLQRFATIVRSAPDAIVAVDPGCHITEWNPGAERLFGWTASEVVGRSVEQLVPSERAHEFAEIRAQLGRGGVIAGLATQRRHKDGRLADVSLTVAPFTDEDGNFAGACSISRDVSEQKKLQARLAVVDRLASVGTMAAGVAHEINNPLSFVLMNLEVVQDELGRVAAALPADLGATVRGLLEPLQDAREGAERVRVIVRDMRTLARGDDERNAVLDVRTVVGASIGMAWNEIRHRAELVRDLGPVPLVRANEGRLGQVVLNLLVNAAQSLDERGEGSNRITVRTRTDVAGHAVVEVEDTGRGIPPENLARVFDPFFTTKPPGQGLGLGLSICLSLVRGMGGEMHVESLAGRGTTFTVRLPPAAPVDEAAAPAPPAEASGPRRLRVLVVDDEGLVASAIARLLRPLHDVEVATSAAAALDALATRPPDVVLCDLLMPGVSGAELYEQLLVRDPALARRVVFMTGGAFTARARAFLDTAGRPALEKPFTVEQFAQTVRALAV